MQYKLNNAVAIKERVGRSVFVNRRKALTTVGQSVFVNRRKALTTEFDI